MRYLITFTGDPKGGANPPSVTVHGEEFPLGRPVALEFTSAAGMAMLSKLKGNGHFRVEQADEAAPEPTPKSAKAPKVSKQAKAPKAPEPEPDTSEWDD